MLGVPALMSACVGDSRTCMFSWSAGCCSAATARAYAAVLPQQQHCSHACSSCPPLPQELPRKVLVQLQSKLRTEMLLVC
jgi:hypothetical protein